MSLLDDFIQILNRINKYEIKYYKINNLFVYSKNQFHNYILKDSLSFSENILSEIFKKQNLS